MKKNKTRLTKKTTNILIHIFIFKPSTYLKTPKIFAYKYIAKGAKIIGSTKKAPAAINVETCESQNTVASTNGRTVIEKGNETKIFI